LYCISLCYVFGILPVVLYECETWSLTLRDEHRLRMFENTVLRKIAYEKGRNKGFQQTA
jgi:hypothetical protein